MRSEAQVTLLQVFPEKGAPGILCDRVLAIAGQGLEGDRHADGGPKQISLLDRDVRRWMKETSEQGLCFRRFKENLQIDGGLIPKLAAGMILEIGTARIRITGRSKRCFPECCLFREGRECLLSRGNAWAEVIKDGEIKTGDTVTIFE